MRPLRARLSARSAKLAARPLEPDAPNAEPGPCSRVRRRWRNFSVSAPQERAQLGSGNGAHDFVATGANVRQ